MLFLLFQVGKERYAIEAGGVVEVAPLLPMKRLPKAPKGVAGVFNYRGRPVPAVDLSELTQGRPSEVRLSTRIIIVNYPHGHGGNRLLGLVAEHATEMLRASRRDFIDPGVRIGDAPYLGPVLMDARGSIQLLIERNLLAQPVQDLLFSEAAVPCV